MSGSLQAPASVPSSLLWDLATVPAFQPFPLSPIRAQLSLKERVGQLTPPHTHTHTSLPCFSKEAVS